MKINDVLVGTDKICTSLGETVHRVCDTIQVHTVHIEIEFTALYISTLIHKYY